MNSHDSKEDDEFSDNDEDLAKAIALSLKQQREQHQHQHQEGVNETKNIQGQQKTRSIGNELDRHEQEEQDMRLALALSLGKTVEQLTARDILMLDTSLSSGFPSAVVNVGGIKSDQRQTRQEPIILDSDEDEEDTNDNLQEQLKKKRRINNLDSSDMKYWDGVVKLTHVRGFVGTTFIKFEDIVQKANLKKALVTAFVWSKDFIDEHFPSDVNVCIVSHGRPATRTQLGINRLLINPPLKDGRYGCFHIKLMLLFHDVSMRVVIGSANLESYDYNDLENVVFIQDFPLLPTNDSRSRDWKTLPQFGKDLCTLLDEMYVPVSVKEEVSKYDFTKAKAHIVASVSGVFEGENEYRKYGHTRLADIINDIGANDPAMRPKIEMQTSSLGSLSTTYLKELYASFCGIHPYTDSTAKKVDTPPPSIDIIYPTSETVHSSRLGPSGADTICLSTSAWQRPTFPKHVMCDSISHRPGTLMHSKYIIATLLDSEGNTVSSPKSNKTSTSEDTDEPILGWMYCGSHNATMSAWGKLTLSRDTKRPKMNISNWELGVILPITEKSDLPAPYLRPAPRYKPGQRAWTQRLDY